jgi:hypothetical protein
MTEAEGRPVEACSIVVTVVGSRPGKRLFDDERFTDPETFVTRLTRQALWRWTEVSADVAGCRFGVSIRLRRRMVDSQPPYGVSLSVAAKRTEDAAQAQIIRDRVAASLSRGGFRDAREPERGRGHKTEIDAALDRRYRARQSLVWKIALAVGLVGGVLVGFIGVLLSLAYGHYNLNSVPAGVLIAASATGLVVAIGVVACRSQLFPALEIADTTPGRRIMLSLTRGLGAGTLLTAGVQLVRHLVGGK